MRRRRGQPHRQPLAQKGDQRPHALAHQVVDLKLGVAVEIGGGQIGKIDAVIHAGRSSLHGGAVGQAGRHDDGRCRHILPLGGSSAASIRSQLRS
jgi:hypothetical protein